MREPRRRRSTTTLRLALGVLPLAPGGASCLICCASACSVRIERFLPAAPTPQRTFSRFKTASSCVSLSIAAPLCLVSASRSKGRRCHAHQHLHTSAALCGKQACMVPAPRTAAAHVPGPSRCRRVRRRLSGQPRGINANHCSTGQRNRALASSLPGPLIFSVVPRRSDEGLSRSQRYSEATAPAKSLRCIAAPYRLVLRPDDHGVTGEVDAVSKLQHRTMPRSNFELSIR